MQIAIAFSRKLDMRSFRKQYGTSNPKQFQNADDNELPSAAISPPARIGFVNQTS
jgi:hypothetical protein